MQLLKWSPPFALLIVFACQKNDPVPPVETDCKYKFATTLPDICGAWEPKRIINPATADTVNYAVGEGHTGFIFDGFYADAFELRPDSTLSLYYVTGGRHCKTRVDGHWFVANDSLVMLPHNQTYKLPLLALSKAELTVMMEVNFKISKAVYRKRNE